MTRRIEIPGTQLHKEDTPEDVAEAQNFSQEILVFDDGDAVGDARVYQLSPEVGGAILVHAHNWEAELGAVELYTGDGEFLGAGFYFAAGILWLGVNQVREAVANQHPPYELTPRDQPLEWYMDGPVACSSIGGRFFILPSQEQPAPAHTLQDRVTGTEYPCHSLEAAQALAVELYQQG